MPKDYNEMHEEHKEEDDGEGINSHTDYNFRASKQTDNHDQKMGDLDKFIGKHNPEGVKLSVTDNALYNVNDDYFKKRGRPRDTYEVFLDKIDDKLKKLKDVNINFEEKKKLLVKQNY